LYYSELLSGVRVRGQSGGQRALLVARRRAGIVGLSFGFLVVLLLGTMIVSPARFVATATLATADGQPYPESFVSALTETSASPEFLTHVAAASSQADARTLRLELNRKAGALALKVEGPTEGQAQQALLCAAESLIATDSLVRGVSQAAAVTTDLEALRAPIAATREQEVTCQARLEELEASTPDLADDTLESRARQLEGELRETQVKLDGLHAELESRSEHVEALDRQVSSEALVAYRADLEEQRREEQRLEEQRLERQRLEQRERLEAQRRARQLELTQASPTPRQQPAAGPTASPAEGSGQARAWPPSTRVQALELELERMRTHRTDRHPAVKRLLRELEVERRRQPPPPPPISTPTPAPAPAERSTPPSEPSARPAWERPIADGEPDAPQPAPEKYRLEAPSYPDYLAAQEAAADSVEKIRVAEEEKETRLRAKADLEQRVQSLGPIRAEVEALLEQLDALEEQRAAQEDVLAKAERASANAVAPLTLRGEEGQQIRISTEQAGPIGWFEGMLVALLLAVGAGVGSELRDRSFHRAEEVQDALGVPVLGVIPHGRGR
jgi:hypothetical protein